MPHKHQPAKHHGAPSTKDPATAQSGGASNEPVDENQSTPPNSPSPGTAKTFSVDENQSTAEGGATGQSDQGPGVDENSSTQTSHHGSTQDPSATLQNPLAQRVLDLEKALNETQQKNEEMTVAAKHALADLQNFKRRTEEERSRFAQFACATILREIIPTLDNFHRAFKHAPEEGPAKEWGDSVKNIVQQLEKSLENQGLKKIETLGKKFDHNFHEALLSGPGEKDTIIEELEPGYALGDFVIKPARVKVGNGEKA